ncbi:MAG: 4-hydroxyphenylacetate 3-monooxygenase, oxygenase component [Burkholderiales bacterium]|nr:4-hydroxyphenylacetate 3-monooxygenase, oxygenase component [Burkholderiales bacterium]
MGARTGEAYLQGLRARPREVWVRGRRVDDVTAHPAFARPAAHIARLYDMQHEPAHRDVLTYASPTSGERVGTAFMMSATVDDLVKRRRAFQTWAESSFGLLGRSPDFLNTTLMAFAESPGVFEEMGPRFAANIRNYYEFVRENDLFLTHALITPQTDRSRSSKDQADAFLHMGVVRETADGIVLRGARMLATHGPIADEVIVYHLPGIRPGEEPYAAAFAIPVDTPGVRQICREPFDEGARAAYDHPLGSHFEEPDALLIFDDVLVPWERVFLHARVDLANRMYTETALRNHTAHQTGVRAIAKMQLAVGVAMAVAETVRCNGFLHIQELLGEAIGYIELARSCVIRAEVEHERTAAGTIRAGFTPLQTLRGMMSSAYPRIIEILQKVGAGGLLMMPTAADFASPVGDDVRRYYRGAGEISAEDRVRIFKLAWDLAGDAFGMRAMQYERYYAGDPVRLVASNYTSYAHRGECDRLVAGALALAGRP